MCSLLKASKILFVVFLLSCHGQSYEFGYHPSDEEFDSFMRDSARTWTRDLVAQQRRPSGRLRSFEPKYRYEKATESNRPAKQDKIVDNTERLDQLPEASSQVTRGQLASMLDFTMFSGEDTQSNLVEQQEGQAAESQSQAPWNFDVKTYGKPQLNLPNKDSSPSPSSVLFNFDTEPPNKIDDPRPLKQPHIQQPANPDDGANFPIFFTNPVTGIVYAITEVGKMPAHNNTRLNAAATNSTAIPIYITKEQYERDLDQQKRFYENKCQRLDEPAMTTITTIWSHSVNTTDRPQIIRLKKPPAGGEKLSAAKLPTNGRPPPVMVQTGLLVNDNVRLSGNRKPNTTPPTPPTVGSGLKKKKKHKTRSHKRPGRKSTTSRPAVTVTTKKTPSSYPYIVRGTVKPSASTDRLSTQLEKPNTPTDSFNHRLSAHLTPLSRTEHSIRKRSLENSTEDAEDGHRNERKIREVNNKNKLNNVFSEKDKDKDNANKTKPQKDIGNEQTNTKGHQGNQTQRIHSKNHTKNCTSHGSKRKVKPSKNLRHNLTQINTVSTTATTSTQLNQQVTQSPSSTPRSSHKVMALKKNHVKKDEEDESLLSWFSYEEDDDYSQEKDDYYDETVATTKKRADLKEPIVTEDSSADEGVDIGALPPDRDEEQTDESSSSSEEIDSATKTDVAKKRIRRRPSGESVSAEYYDDDDDGDGGGMGSMVGGFFRMVFYPVQMLMSSMMDSFAGSGGGGAEDESTPPKTGRPLYTLYNNNVHRGGDSDDYDDDDGDEKPGLLTGWLSSLFGLSRRTKKIGSTPRPTQAAHTDVAADYDEEEEETGWFDSWFGNSKTTTTTTEATSYDDEEKWFFGWFDTKPSTKKQKQRRRSTSTTTTTPVAPVMPQVPILTIVDPLRNPQNWIGILANHLINSTSTHNPVAEMVSRFTTPPPHPSTYIDHSGTPRKVYYDNYQIWRLKPQNDADVEALEELKKSNDGLKLRWLRGPTLRGLTDVLVPPKMLIDFQGSLNFEGIAYEVVIFDVGKAIAYEKSKEYLVSAEQPSTKKPKNKKSPFTMTWNKYHTFDEIISYLETIRMRQPQIVDLIHIGRSYEGRPLVIVKIESKEKAAATANAYMGYAKLGQRKNLNLGNTVFIDSGTHGNEWIGPATTTWMISEVLRAMKSNKTSGDGDLIRNTTWYFMPVMNPDGYAYTHEFDRFWKKSRSRNVYRPDDFISSAMTWLQQKKPTERICYGADLQRNWHYQWGRKGSSKVACNEFYAGSAPFSEPETKAVSDFLMEYRKQIQLYISMQAYGQIISFPSKANSSFHTDRNDDLLDVAMVAIDGLRKKGSKTRYKVDLSNDLIEGRSGCSDAFAAYEVGIPLSYTIQLADNGVHGYLLPSSSIEPTARDVFDIVTAMLDYM